MLLKGRKFQFLTKNLCRNAWQKESSKKLFSLSIVYIVDFLLQIVSLTPKPTHETKSLKQIESYVLDIAQNLAF